MNSLDSWMRWNQIQKLLNALSDDVTVITNDTENYLHVSAKNIVSGSTEVLESPALKQFNDLWKFVSNNAKPSEQFLQYLNTELSALKHEERSKIASWTEQMQQMLSTRMNGLNLKVNIPNPLTRMLLLAINDANTVRGDNYSLHVCVQIIQPEASNLQLHSEDHRSRQFTDTIFDDMVNDAQVLIALVIVLKCYPPQWRQNFFWDAWLAVTIQLCLSAKLGPDKVTFPCVWMRQAFDAERLAMSPERVQHLLFGKDPVSKTSTYGLNELCKATGIAFHAVGDDNPSIKGMKTHYGLNCDGDNPKQYISSGLFMVNLIRCIGENDESLSRNSCRGAWIAYTLKIIHHFSCKHKPVMVFTTASSALPEIYIPAVCSGDIVRVPHPSAPPEGTSDNQRNINKVCDYLKGYSSQVLPPDTLIQQRLSQIEPETPPSQFNSQCSSPPVLLNNEQIPYNQRQHQHQLRHGHSVLLCPYHDVQYGHCPNYCRWRPPCYICRSSQEGD